MIHSKKNVAAYLNVVFKFYYFLIVLFFMALLPESYSLDLTTRKPLPFHR